MDCLTPDDIYAAAKQLSSKIINTPTLPAPALSKLLGCQLYLKHEQLQHTCLLYTSPSPRDKRQSRMPSSA